MRLETRRPGGKPSNRLKYWQAKCRECATPLTCHVGLPEGVEYDYKVGASYLCEACDKAIAKRPRKPPMLTNMSEIEAVLADIKDKHDLVVRSVAALRSENPDMHEAKEVPEGQRLMGTAEVAFRRALASSPPPPAGEPKP